MPHIIVKAWPGKDENKKKRLAEAITRDVMEIFGNEEESVSVSIVEIDPGRWKTEVYRPDILDKPDQLYKKPGYEM